MRKHRIIFPCLLLLTIVLSVQAVAQSWDFIKEKDGIKVYTRKKPGSSLKSFKGVADIHTTTEKVYNLIGNVRNVDWWDKNVKEIRVLFFEKEKHSQYYLVYDSPWPVADRDLCVDATITTDPVTGVRIVNSVPLPGAVPEREDLVRIRDYWQRWTITPTGNGYIHVELEGFVDPGGSIPDWVYNMVITESPIKVIRGIRQRIETK